MFSNTKNIIFSFDYELFLGTNSGTPQNCLIIPTNYLLNLFRKYHVKNAVFFVDTTYLIKMKEYSQQYSQISTDFELIKKQLIQLAEDGHYIFPHLHPHWEDAKYDKITNTWDLSIVAKYRFHNLSSVEKEQIFEQSIAILNEIILPVCPDYRCDSYRAGGLSIQPFSDFKPFFEKHGIINDFSVIPETFEIGSLITRFFDFRNASHLNYYKFNEEVNKVDYTGKFNEFTVSTVRFNNFEKIINKVINKLGNLINNEKNFGDGLGASFDEEIKEVNTKEEVVSFEWTNKYKLYKYKKQLNARNYIHFLSHPKMLTKKNFNSLEYFLSKLHKQTINFDFRELVHSKPSVLILSYITPPEEGIGGRRWAKFGKYLSRNSFDVGYVSAKLLNKSKVSSWVDDVKGLPILRLNRLYPLALEINEKTIWNKLIYKISYFIRKIRVKGSVYDKSALWEQQLTKWCNKNIVKNNIYCVIATAPPFNLMYVSSKLKSQFPYLKIICDFRDPWTLGELYGFKTLESKRLNYENFKESETIKNSDYVTCAASMVYDGLLNKYQEFNKKIHLIPHGYDMDEINLSKTIKSSNDKIRILFSGSLYEDINKEIEVLLKFIKDYQDLIEVDFYIFNNPYADIFKNYQLPNVKLFKKMYSKDFFKIINNYNFSLLITNNRIKDIKSTKYYEILRSNLPIVYMGPKGELLNDILSKDVGFNFTIDLENKEKSYAILKNYLNYSFGFDKLDLSKYDFSLLTHEIEKLILK